MPEITKLPKWGQTEITSRDRRIKELEQENAALRAIQNKEAHDALQPDYLPKAAVLDPYKHKIPIGNGHVRYQFDDKLFLYIDTQYVESQFGDDHVDIHASRGLIIRPTASNCARLYVDPHG